MAIDIIDTVGNQIQVLDDGTTIMDIMNALGWVRQERERKRKYKKVYKPTGKPRGRPKKSPVAEQQLPDQ
jgi:hypothetical protein